MSLSLSGKCSASSSLNLCGTNSNSMLTIPRQIKLLQIRIMNDFMIPLHTKQWTTLYNNLHFVGKYYHKINYFYGLYKSDDLQIYVELLNLLEKFVDNHKILELDEKTHLVKSIHTEMLKSVFKTSAIKLLPEYEIYNSVFGRPDVGSNEKYNPDVIGTIKSLFERNNINYDTIKSHLEDKFEYMQREKATDWVQPISFSL
jgi:hypothetical protein